MTLTTAGAFGELTEEFWKDGFKAERIIRHSRAFVRRIAFQDMTPRPDLVDGEGLWLAAPDSNP